MSRIDAVFNQAGHKALIAYVTVGFPDLEATLEIVPLLEECGCDVIELGIPFSDPLADGVTIQQASFHALQNGVTPTVCLEIAEKLRHRVKVPLVFMTYYNPVYSYGIERFTAACTQSGIDGLIVPDLPPEEGEEYLNAMYDQELSPILIFSPTTSPERMKYLDSYAKGFIYCVARKGVTGEKTDFTNDMSAYLETCRNATSLPLALGFGVKEKKDMDFLKGKVEIAVIGSETIRIVQKEGIDSVGDFIRELR